MRLGIILIIVIAALNVAVDIYIGVLPLSVTVVGPESYMRGAPCSCLCI